MPNIIPPNPVPGFDQNTNNINAANRTGPANQNNPNLHNVPDPSRVIRADGKTERQDNGDTSQPSTLRYDSNFSSFLQRLQASPDLTEIFSRIFSGQTETIVTSGLQTGAAAEIAQLADLLQMDQEQLVTFLKEQMNAGSRFNGPLFTILRGAYQQSSSETMKADILRFCKNYSDNSSTKHIESNIMRNLNQITRSIPATWGGKLDELAKQVQRFINYGDRTGALKLLQGQVLPFMSDYTSRTHDMGTARSFLSLLTLDIARYENGTEANVTQSFQQLKNYPFLNDLIGKLDDKMLMRTLKNTAFAKAPAEGTFVNKLVEFATKALRGDASSETQESVRSMLKSFLVNESVYMPLNHYIIPLEWDGVWMFSELWVDPDADQDAENGRPRREGDENTVRFLFKLDIQSLGFFDMVLACRGENVSLQINCPERIAPFSGTIEKALNGILVDNGLKPEAVIVKKMETPLTISQVFPKIFERKDSINVKI